nr:hypothetical protein 11 [bacterium]
MKPNINIFGISSTIMALVISFVVSTPVTQATEINSSGVLETITLWVDGLLSGIGISLYTAQKWAFEHVLHDMEAAAETQNKIDRIMALTRLRSDRHKNPNCCKDAGCYLPGRIPCKAICVPCDSVERDLEEYL